MNWIRNPKHVNSETLMNEFILLFSVVNEVTLTDDRDKIVWKWTK
jgi:hypothetical protein